MATALLTKLFSPLRRSAFPQARYVRMPACSIRPHTYEGMSYDRMLEIRKCNVTPGYNRPNEAPLLIHQGSMQWVWDHVGRRYLDLHCPALSLGHCHPKVTKRLSEQVDSLWHTTNIYMHHHLHEYVTKLLAKFPPPLKVAIFTNSGSEAIDLAILMTRLHSKAHDIITLRNSYHGSSPVSLGATGMSKYLYQLPLKMGYHQAMNPDPYRGVWGGSNCRDSLSQSLRSCDCSNGECKATSHYVNELEDLMNTSCPPQIGGLLIEPIQGMGGVVQFPRGFLQKSFEAVKKRGGLFVMDEVQTGFGCLGDRFWGFEREGISPDIVVMGGGIANGYPMGTVVTTPEIAATMTLALHFNTYGGSPLACATASAVLDVIDEENLQANCAKVGDVFLKGLMELRDEFEIVGDVRGKGLMLALEFVENKATRKPLAAAEVNEIFELTRENGILVGKGGLYGSVFRIKPPMCLTEEDAKFAVFALRNSILQYIERRK